MGDAGRTIRGSRVGPARLAAGVAFALLATACSAAQSTTPPPARPHADNTPVNCPLNDSSEAQACWGASTGIPGWTEDELAKGTNSDSLVPPARRVPASSLTTHDGDLRITAAHTTISNEIIKGCVTLASGANDVTISSSLIVTTHLCQGGDEQGGASAVNDGLTGVSGLLLQDVEIDGLDGVGDPAYGLGGSNWRCQRCHIHGFTHDVSMPSNDTLTNSYLSDTSTRNDGGHAEAVFADSAQHATIDHDWIRADSPISTTAAVMSGTDWGDPSGLTITNSFLEGAPGVDLEAGSCHMTDFSVTDTVFSSHAWPVPVNYWNPGPTNHWSGNVDEHGVSIPEPQRPAGC